MTMRKEYGGMGFRHFYGFNLAMLGKQGWKLATDHDAIVSRVFKARYYPKVGFLEANLGHNPSYVWRSIHSSQVVVREGMRWKLGDGSKVNIWREPWLRGSESALVTSHPSAGAEQLCVSHLIDQQGLCWRSEVLRQLFNQRDIKEIMRIPILQVTGDDRAVWRLSRNGRYSVKSAYYHIMEKLCDNTHLRVQGDWQAIWKIKVPNTIRVFLWRVARGCLPTRMKLQKKGINCSPFCVHCKETFENDWHCLIGCDTAVEVWRKAGMWSIIESFIQSAEDIKDLLFKLLAATSTNQHSKIAMMMWSLWGSRNMKLWEDINFSSATVIGRAIATLDDWRKFSSQPYVNQDQRCAGSGKWVKPNANGLKCNIDAALFNDQNCYGIGLCLRNDEGTLEQAKTVRYQGIPLPHEAEAVGLREAIIWLEGLGVDKVIIEMDCKMVVDEIKRPFRQMTEFGDIIMRCIELLSVNPNFEVTFIRRQANIVAHALARAAIFYASHQVFEIAPNCIEDLILNEML